VKLDIFGDRYKSNRCAVYRIPGYFRKHKRRFWQVGQERTRFPAGGRRGVQAEFQKMTCASSTRAFRPRDDCEELLRANPQFLSRSK